MAIIFPPLVLMYHSICEPSAKGDPFELHVDPERFREQLRGLADTYSIIRLSDLARGLLEQKLRPNTVALTFDDGYANNLFVAAPILQEFGATASLFVCTGFLNREAFWWDQLVETILTARVAPPRLLNEELDLRNAEILLRKYARNRNPDHAKKLILSIWRSLLPLRLEEKYNILAELARLFEPEEFPSDLRPLRAEEVSTASAYFEIGAHSVTHPRMSQLDASQLEAEILESKRLCEALSGRTVESFAFPFGNFDASCVREVSRHMPVACTTQEAPISPGTFACQIPRINVCNWSAAQLQEKIEKVVESSRSSSIFPTAEKKVSVSLPFSAKLDPAVSVIMRFDNVEENLCEAIDSLFRQSFASWELVIVNVGSTERLHAIAPPLRSLVPNRIVFLEPSTGHHAYEPELDGLKAARGEFISFLDANICWMPEKLNHDVTILRQFTNAAAVFSPVLCWSDSEPPRVSRLDEPRNEIHPPVSSSRDTALGSTTGPFRHSTFTIRQAVMSSQIAGFRSNGQKFYSDLTVKFPVYVSSCCLAEYREQNLTRKTVVTSIGT